MYFFTFIWVISLFSLFKISGYSVINKVFCKDCRNCFQIWHPEGFYFGEYLCKHKKLIIKSKTFYDKKETYPKCKNLNRNNSCKYYSKKFLGIF